MSYEVLARKWRPQTFDDVVGQDHITRTLKKAVESGRLSHAYLFAGPRGCGKTSTARILAKVINCADLKSGNPCNKCASCTGVVQGNNLDVMEIDGASHTSVNEVRDLQESIGYVPSQFANKIYIIDEVHMLSTHAFNALLKTLEEPPPHVYFIFATTAPHKIPDTIKSRCQRHHFKRLEIGEIADQLTKVCKAEKVKYEDDALRLLARKAEGSMRDGESLLDQCITASSGEVLTKSVRSILGLLDQEMVVEFIGRVSRRDATEVLRQLDTAIHDGVDIEELLAALIEGYRDLMLLAASESLDRMIFRSKEEIESLKGILPEYELGDLVTIVERLCNAVPRMKMAGDPRILMESVLVDLALLDRQSDIREVIAKLERGGGVEAGAQTKARKKITKTGRTQKAAPAESTASARLLRGGPDDFAQTGGTADPPDLQTRRAPSDAATAPAEGPAAAARGESGREAEGGVRKEGEIASLDYASLRQLWTGFVTHIRQKKVALGVCLISGTLHSIDRGTVMLRFSRGFKYQKGQVEDPANKKFLRGMMKKYFGRELELVCFSEGEEKQAEREKLRMRKESEEPTATRAIENQPIVKKILADLDGEIVRYHPQ